MLKKISIILILMPFLISCKKFNMFRDSEQPKIVNSYPNSSTGIIARDTKFWIEFDKSMDTQITETSFSISTTGLSAGTTNTGFVTGRIEWQNGNKKLVYTPFSLLEPNQQYVMVLTKSAEDTEGNDISLKDPYSIYFSITGLQTDRPKFVAENSYFTKMVNGSANYPVPQSNIIDGVATDSKIVLGFTKPLDRNTIWTGINFSGGAGGSNFTIVWMNGDAAVEITPIQPLVYSTNYQIVMNETLKDKNGNKLYEEKRINFTVGADFLRPKIVYVAVKRQVAVDVLYSPGLVNFENTVFPIDDSNPLDLRPTLIIEFDKPMNQEKFFSVFSFIVTPFAIKWSNNRVEISFPNPLTHGTTYDLKIDESLTDTLGNTLYKGAIYKFRMGADMTPLSITGIDVYSGEPSVPASILTSREISLNPPDPRAQNPSIVVNFDKEVNPNIFLQKFSISPTVSKNATWTNGNKTVTISFNEKLQWHTRYTLTFPKDIEAANKNMMDKDDIYWINVGTDYNRPNIVTILTSEKGFYPEPPSSDNFYHDVKKNDTIRLSFNKLMDIETIKNKLQLLNYNGSPVSFYVKDNGSYVYEICTYAYYEASGKYELVLSTDIKDLQGNPLNGGLGRYRFVIDHYASKILEFKNNDCSGTSHFMCRKDYQDGAWYPFNYNNSYDSVNIDSNGKVLDYIRIYFDAPLEQNSVKSNVSVGNTTIPWDKFLIENSNPYYIEIQVINIINPGPSVYTLTINGGPNGIKNIYGNGLKDNFVTYFIIKK